MRFRSSFHHIRFVRWLFFTAALLCALNGFSQLTLRLASQTPPSGCTARDGSVTLTASGGSPGYRYSMDLVNFQRSPSFTGLASGVYSFYLIDRTLNVTAVSVALNGPCTIGIGFSYSLYVCGIGGFIKVTQAFGGTAPYQYALDGNNFRDGRDFEFLTSGVHHLFVKDAAGLVLDYALPIYPLCTTTLTATLTNASCDRSDGSLIVDVSANGGDYDYSLDGITFQAEPQFPRLPAGTYDVTVRSRADGQTAQILGLRIRSDCPEVTATPAIETCGRGDGSITASGSLGTPPYMYSVDGQNFQSGNVIANLPAGDYTLTIKDVNGFVAATPVTVGSGCISIALQTSNPTCNRSNGSVTVAATDGAGPYEYSIDGVNFQPGAFFGNLSAGNYTITVKDSRRVVNSKSVLLVNPTAATLAAEATAASCSNDDGSITAIATGGVMPLQYSLDGIRYQAGNLFTGVASGSHLAWVKDADGCTGSAPVTVPLNRDITVDAGPPVAVCQGGSVRLPAVSDATGFSWTPVSTLNDPGLLQPIASPVTSTVYTLTVTKGVCEAQDEITVTVNAAPVADAGPDQTVCYGKDIALRGEGGAGYTWQPASGLSDPTASDPVVIHPVATTRFFLFVTDAGGCRSLKADTVVLSVTPPAVVFAGNDTVIAPGEPLQLMAVDVHGAGFNRYSWDPPGNLSDPALPDPVATVTVSETFTVTATTNKGCQGTDAINVKVIRGPEIYVPNAFTPNGDGRNDALRPVLVGIKGFLAFSVFNRAGQQVFYTTDPGNGWNGTLHGQPQPAGGFVWMVEGVDYTGKKIKRSGPVILIR